jgi:hypothetical protein
LNAFLCHFMGWRPAPVWSPVGSAVFTIGVKPAIRAELGCSAREAAHGGLSPNQRSSERRNRYREMVRGSPRNQKPHIHVRNTELKRVAFSTLRRGELRCSVRFTCGALSQKRSGRGHHRGDNTGLRCLHPANLPRAERAHALTGVIDLTATIQAYLIGLLLQREWSCLADMAAPKDHIVEELQQRTNPIHEEKRSFPRLVASGPSAFCSLFMMHCA